ALVKAVNADLPSCVQLLLSYGANVNYNNAEALRSAVSAGNTAFTQLILNCNPDREFVTLAFSNLPRSGPESLLHHLMLLLLKSGASGTSVDEELITAARKCQWQIIDLL